MVRSCCVVGCNVRSHDRQENKLEKGLSFHSSPTWKQHERPAWIAAVRRADISSLPSPNICWCSRHFHSVVLILKKEAKISLFLYSTFEQRDSVSTYSVNANYLHGSALQA
uniref:THAP-type domain-containing protein n=1 Tax=Maylandia zebra TaxID=106582 RepID=A0A3P9BJG2_9CICH